MEIEKIIINCFHSEKNIAAFMTFYRGTFSHAAVTLKLHIVKKHVVPWIQEWEWKVSFGLMGEQKAFIVRLIERERSTRC